MSTVNAEATGARSPFSHPDWIFELKWDGFRAIAYIEEGRCKLVSRNRNEFRVLSDPE